MWPLGLQTPRNGPVAPLVVGSCSWTSPSEMWGLGPWRGIKVPSRPLCYTLISRGPRIPDHTLLCPLPSKRGP